ncbi:alpha-glucosidase (family GH31 glycosyl hydrolase) [Nakamurella flavida]|uniref:glycoside hydrolase family 31 protein n=1 Tax=Nakamurella flavida TaxID=363630 RepID=UPI0027823F06|nr:glycoside hydrolase family 31 protein [Nakamurella flavida]MDP9779587.1 alpha-glucosidase (family GH31 glycosyl hydrolase) [Nakamurella flavida]
MPRPPAVSTLPVLPTRPVVDPAAVVRGETWRISVLTDGLLRLEYAADGVFEDRASTFALNRDLPVPEFTVVDGPTHLEIRTARAHLTYDRGPFSTSGLSVQVRGNVSNYHSVWRFGEIAHDDANLGGTARTLDNVDGAVALEPGVLSRNGYAVLDDSRSLLLTDDGWVTPRDGSRTDLYVFTHGRDFDEALRDFHAVSGPTPVLPRFALGNWWSRYHRYTADSYRALIERFAAEGVPFSVSVIDMDWHLVDVEEKYGSGWTGYTWNRDLFPDPDAFLTWLHEHGLRVTLNVHPADGVRAYEELYPEMARALGRDPESGDPLAFDVTDREFLAAYFDVLHAELERGGVDFWWLDWQSGPHSRVAGIDPLWMLNHFHFLDNATTPDGKPRRPLTFSRYAGPGSHRYPVGFSGDSIVTWASLEFQPEFTATAANIGYGWWSHDIGGHMMGVKDDELATRWVQLGTFSPILRLHSASNPFATKEPWSFGTAAAAVMTDFLRLRHRLVPYLHTMNHRAARESLALVRPMYHSHPEAPEAYRVPTQFTFGSELVVAPITAPIERELQLGSVRAWLPAGEWVDVLTGLRYTGGREIVLHRDLTSIPALAPAGAILPLDGRDIPGNGTEHPGHLELLVVPGADGAFTLIEDDGAGDGLDPAGIARTAITWNQQTGVLEIAALVGDAAIVPAARTWSVALLGLAPDAVSRVLVDGEPVDAAVGPATPGTAARLAVTVADVPATSVVRVETSADPRPVPADVPTLLFALLDRAHVGYDLKRELYGILTADEPLTVRLSHLQARQVPRGLETALSEILLAQV